MTADWTPHCLVCGRPASDPCQRCAELDPTDENADVVLAYQRHWLRHYRQRYIEGMPS